MNFISENILPVMVMPPAADLFDTAQSSTPVNTKNYGHVCFVLQIGSGGTGTATMIVEECSDSSGTGNTAIAFKYKKATTGDTYGAWVDVASTGVATTAGTNDTYIVEVDAKALSSGKQFVRLTFTEVVNSPVVGAVLALMGQPRFAQASPTTALT